MESLTNAKRFDGELVHATRDATNGWPCVRGAGEAAQVFRAWRDGEFRAIFGFSLAMGRDEKSGTLAQPEGQRLWLGTSGTTA